MRGSGSSDRFRSGGSVSSDSQAGFCSLHDALTVWRACRSSLFPPLAQVSVVLASLTVTPIPSQGRPVRERRVGGVPLENGCCRQGGQGSAAQRRRPWHILRPGTIRRSRRSFLPTSRCCTGGRTVGPVKPFSPFSSLEEAKCGFEVAREWSVPVSCNVDP